MLVNLTSSGSVRLRATTAGDAVGRFERSLVVELGAHRTRSDSFAVSRAEISLYASRGESGIPCRG